MDGTWGAGAGGAADPRDAGDAGGGVALLSAAGLGGRELEERALLEGMLGKAQHEDAWEYAATSPALLRLLRERGLPAPDAPFGAVWGGAAEGGAVVNLPEHVRVVWVADARGVAACRAALAAALEVGGDSEW